jgi:hypothetical protein
MKYEKAKYLKDKLIEKDGFAVFSTTIGTRLYLVKDGNKLAQNN